MLGPFVVLLMGAVIVVQWWSITRYLAWFRGFDSPTVNDATLPRAAIISSIRGAAPSLAECLKKLAEQDYPDYRIHLVVDHPTDPANEIIGHWLETRPRRPVSISFLEDPSPKAYLKTSAILQATRSLPDDVEAVVLADADTLAYSEWLKDLVIPLQTKSVGLVTGNRWYDPTAHSAGALCRFFYNAICVAPMYFMKATWEGSLSIKREVYGTEFFQSEMQDTSSEAAAIQAAASKEGLSLIVQPDVMMYNAEPCSLLGAFDFIKRQLLWTRLYHPAWRSLLIGTWALHIMFAGILFGGIYYLTTGPMLTGVALLGAVGMQVVASLCFAEQLHSAISTRIRSEQGIELPVITWSARLRMLLALPLAFVVMSYAMLAAALSRTVTWSGITYQVIPPYSLRMMEYKPWLATRDRQLPSIDPLITPIRDTDYLVDLIVEISGKDREEVTRRFEQEKQDLGSNVRNALAAANIEPYKHSPALEKFYADTDAFLYESLVWNRSPLKNEMRQWIGNYLASRSRRPLRVLSFGDGLGIDAYYLAQMGHEVTYFDVSQQCSTFAKQIFDRGNLNVTMLNSPEQLPADSFDAILCLDVLEHVPNPLSLVGWLSGLLRVGGDLIVHAPFHFIDPAVQTHLRSNQRYSGDWKSLYEPHCLHPVAGGIFWNPIVFRKFSEQSKLWSGPPWQIRLGQLLLLSGSVWSWPHNAVTKWLIAKQKQ